MRDALEGPRWTTWLRGYGPLIGLVIAFLLMVAVVPSKGPEVQAASTSSAIDPASITVDKPASGETTICPDRAQQVVGDSYSPPCFTFSGDNGGETAKGVTKDEIIVTYRFQTAPDLLTLVGIASGDKAMKPNTSEQIRDTAQALSEYFNANFQFWGRKIKFVEYDGVGNALTELIGQGQDKANIDATKVADEIGAFADVSAITQPYNEALAKKKVIGVGAPYLSSDYFKKNAPYSWSETPNCTDVAAAANDLAAKQILDKPAKYAAGDLKDKPRKVAIVRPDNEEYKKCADTGIATLNANGFNVDIIEYQLNPSTMPDQAASVVSKLKAGNYTTVGCACDPNFPLYLTRKATDQGLTPEWLVMGTALTDTDGIGRLYEQSQWRRAFGATVLGSEVPLEESDGYKAFKKMRPNAEPATVVSSLYQQAYLLALGIQMAGPALTPQNFEKGMFAYSEHTGQFGTWKWAPGKYTPQTDQELVWWDPDATSVATGLKGAYVHTGVRAKVGEFPEGEPKVFAR